MRVFERIKEFVKNIFCKKEEVKYIEEYRTENFEEKRAEFIKSIKGKSRNNRKIETLVCPGNGLGINEGIKY